MIPFSTQGLFRSVMLNFRALEDFLVIFYFLTSSSILHGHIVRKDSNLNIFETWFMLKGQSSENPPRPDLEEATPQITHEKQS